MLIIRFLEKTVDYAFAFLPRKIPKSLPLSNPRLIAHRGAHNKKKGIIENTDTAFAEALALGCWGIEFDLHATADGVLVVNHDPTLKRLWGKNVAIRELSFKQLRELVPEVPSFAEVVERYGKRLHLFIELKAPFNAEASLYHDLRTLTPCVDYHLLTLKEPVFASMTLFSSEVMLLVAVHNNVSQFASLCLQKQYGGVLGHYLLFDDNQLEKLKSAKKKVGVGMVDSKFSLYRELNRGLKWVFTNNAAPMVQYLKELQESR
ncbi:glycerophosphodiester phosphodiesterase [Legionella micdadei]|uniref:Glycerophosphoryl diester phosphodiesterase n=1 Tax=Legionella micdadei TaxID=451 RepID=A0A098GIQ6_LEGMI|nr:glycerophosphodiester phosphodiesterase family protein [Legionella micdadei]ARG98758.1 glycerophosphodiester phosphodiesterase [Legionella micdadei]ARH01477.1 glycerophosphodiester phosphodiesterase [Legionella micdadei]KTD28981.1 glycerophosphoryl diester phosphodiesterase [Legionella micdadei]NSL17192.1 glycerophosphodiester phosphodiesterase [Legionella micdadei]CEG62364.1 putative glycerophosphoryl diester phosphodiesterase [Legionella micdadei]